MLASATVVNNAKLRAQQGFSLIELLVVVAIIGVLAAAGIVGYQSYLDGVKVDTQKNNILAISRALQLADPARAGELSGVPYHCSRSEFPTQLLSAAAITAGDKNQESDEEDTLNCIVSSVGGAKAFEKFKSPFDSRRFGVVSGIQPDGTGTGVSVKQRAADTAVAVGVGDSGANPNDLSYLRWKQPANTIPTTATSAPDKVFVTDTSVTPPVNDCSGNKDMLLAYALDFTGPPLKTYVYIAGCDANAELIPGSEQRIELN